MMCTKRVRILENVLNLMAVVGLFTLFVHKTFPSSILVRQILAPDQRVTATIANHRVHGVSVKQNASKEIPGSIVVHQWLQECGFRSLRQMYQSSLFPKYPDEIIFISKPFINSSRRNHGRRMSGYLHVPETGFYIFQVKSTGEAELWLSTTNHEHLHNIINHVSNDRAIIIQDSHLSSEMFLDKENAYPFELFHVGQFVEISWLRPGFQQFTAVERKHISYDTNSFAHEVVASLSSHKQRINDNIVPFYLVAFITEWVKNGAAARCAFHVRDTLEKNKKTHSNAHLKINAKTVYSDRDGSKKHLWNKTTEVKTLVDLYMKGLEKIFPKKYIVKRLYKMERLSLIQNQMPLYLMQLEFVVDGLDYTERVVDYIHRHNSTVICRPTYLTINTDAHVNIIIVIKDQIKWLRRFIDKLESLFEQTLEVDMHLVVVSYDRSGFDIGGILKNTSLVQRYTVTKMEGPFSMSRGLNKGVSLAKGKQPIILTCDVHVDLPNTIFEDARTHCIKGRMAFSPIVFQLNCGEDPRVAHPKGYWCYHSYNVIGIYKTDWHRISGMDETKFGPKSYWHFIQRIRNAGIVIVRHKYPGLYRYHTPLEVDPFKAKPVFNETGFFDRDDQ